MTHFRATLVLPPHLLNGKIARHFTWQPIATCADFNLRQERAINEKEDGTYAPVVGSAIRSLTLRDVDFGVGFPASLLVQHSLYQGKAIGRYADVLSVPLSLVLIMHRGDPPSGTVESVATHDVEAELQKPKGWTNANEALEHAYQPSGGIYLEDIEDLFIKGSMMGRGICHADEVYFLFKRGIAIPKEEIDEMLMPPKAGQEHWEGWVPPTDPMAGYVEPSDSFIEVSHESRLRDPLETPSGEDAQSPLPPRQ